MRVVLTLVSGFLLLVSSSRADLTVGAAISMSDAVTEISAAYTKKTGVEIRYTFSGSNVIARQIEAGAPIDVFISADVATMTRLVSEKLIVESSVRPIAGNSLVVVVPVGSETVLKTPSDLQGLTRIAIADPQSVPAGIYAKNWLKGEALWDVVSPKTIPLQNVHAALLAVATENADAAIVYQTDALSSGKVKIALVVADEKTGGIIYPAAVVTDSKKQNAAAGFLRFLGSEESKKIFGDHGFATP